MSCTDLMTSYFQGAAATFGVLTVAMFFAAILWKLSGRSIFPRRPMPDQGVPLRTEPQPFTPPERER